MEIQNKILTSCAKNGLTFRYIYGGKLSLEEYDISYIIKILVAANELNLQELIPLFRILFD